MAERCIFAWENLGPMHEDRLAALAARYPGRVAAIQFWPASETYGWDSNVGHAVPTQTLVERGEACAGWRLAWRLVRACWRKGAKQVYLCHYERWPVFMTAVLLRLGGRRVFCMIDSKFDDHPRRLLRELGKALALAPYSGALAGSPRSEAYLRFLGLRRRPVALGYDTLSVERIRAQAGSPAEAELPHAERNFVIVARLVSKKNIQLALHAYAEWRRETGGARRLQILGSGPLEADLRRLAGELGIGGFVDFEGFVQTERVSGALRGALCLILPSTEEQFGLVVIEAMALGVPPLVSRAAGAVEIMVENGVNGWIIDPASARTLAAAMTRLDRSEREWRDMAGAARADSWRGDCRHFVGAVTVLSCLA